VFLLLYELLDSLPVLQLQHRTALFASLLPGKVTAMGKLLAARARKWEMALIVFPNVTAMYYHNRSQTKVSQPLNFQPGAQPSELSSQYHMW